MAKGHKKYLERIAIRAMGVQTDSVSFAVMGINMKKSNLKMKKVKDYGSRKEL